MGANPTDPEADAQDVTVDATGTAPSGDTAATLVAPDGGTATSTSGLQSGAVLAETYEVQRLLGEGAFGAVWEATHRRLAGRRVAVKVLHDAVTSEEVLARFRHEAEAAARIVHPNVVSVLDYNTLPTGQPYIVLEHLQGEPLGDRLAPGRLPCEEALRIAEQIGRALHAAHSQGVVHRDLKPDNVFLCDGDGPALVKVVDFGISKVADSQTVKTQDAVVIGTPCYMSPEQARGDSRNVDARSDVFALGAIVYEMLTGVRAFDSEQVVSTLYRIIHEQPRPIIELNDTLPESVIAAVERALAKKPEDRFPDMVSFIAALTGASIESAEAETGEWHGETMAAPVSQLDTDLAGAPSESPVPSSSSGPWWPWAVGAAGAVGLIWTFLVPSPAPPAPPAPSPPPPASSPPPSASIETPAATMVGGTNPGPVVVSPGQAAGTFQDAPPWRGLPCKVRPGTTQGTECATGHRAWCDLAGEQSACCAVGLVPTGSRGACVCPPGGVSAAGVLSTGCPSGDSARDREAIRTAMTSTRAAVKACYEDALEGGTQLAGLVSVVIEQGPWGTAEKVSIGRSSLPSKGAQDCVLDAVAVVQLPPPVDGLGKVSWPFRFEPGPLPDSGRGGSGEEGKPSVAEKPSVDKTEPATRPSPSGEAPAQIRRPAQKIPRPPELAKAEAALARARQALQNSRTADAIREAKRSLVYQKSIPRPQAEAYAKLCAEARAAAYELMAKAHCKDLNLPGAKGALAKLGRRGKKHIRKYCREVGLDL